MIRKLLVLILKFRQNLGLIVTPKLKYHSANSYTVRPMKWTLITGPYSYATEPE